MQLELDAGPGNQVVLWLEPSGSFEGHRRTTALRGRLSAEQVASLRELFRDERLAIYRADALPTDGTVDLTGHVDRPVFRVVVREKTGPIRPGSELLDAYFVEMSGHPETNRMLSEVKGILDKESRGR